MSNSPCIQVCVIDPETKLCYGCYRSLPEIAKWGSLSTAERSDVLAEIETRKETLELLPKPN
ncbi:MAG: DUF1289 domain-containing protein [Pseudomonadota bacterium]